MNKLKFVVASTPRSATRYIAAVLNKAGILTTHELLSTHCHNMWGAYVAEILCEVSWLLVPRLNELPSDVVLLHQLRHPVPAINSILRTGHMNPTKTVNTRWLFGPATKSLQLGWPMNVTDRAMYFWWRWHKQIERQGMEHSGVYIRYRVEKLEGWSLHETLSLCLPHSCMPSLLIGPALLQVPKNYNACGSVPRTIGWGDLSSDVRKLAERYGYAEDENV